jgi:diguanylate cyclase (GGDEF)-like protein
LEQQLPHQAFHDTLTGLPNRALFLDRLTQALVRMQRTGHRIAVLFLDLDRFKVVNDSLGHTTGDQLLVAVAQRLVACLRPGDTVARWGGDEFTVLLDDRANATQATHIAQRILDALAPAVMLDGRCIVTTPSIGIAVSTGDETGPDDLLRAADLAMYHAKARGKAQYQLFDARMSVEVVERLELEADLRQALERGEFEVMYQPKVALQRGEVTGFEALLRWHHPTRGLISPAQFIPLAEETGLILPIGHWVLKQACRQATRWQAATPGAPPLTINVNLSARQVQQPGWVAEIDGILAEAGLAPGCLVLEITESVVMDDAAANSVLLGKLKALGVHLAIDDFGTGYSSLNYLKRFPVDVLKIDKAFVDGVGQDVEATAIVEAVITLAHTLGMEVVAEGVETAVQVDQLCRLGCDVGQGYYFAKPLPVDAVDAIVGGGTASVTPPAIVGDGLRALSAPGSPQRAAKPCPMTSAIRDGMYRNVSSG